MLPSPYEGASVLTSLRAFVRLSRPTFLVGGFLGGTLGTVMAAHAAGRVDYAAFAWAQGTITAFHLMTHYSNDYFDRASDVRSERTAFSGGSGALVDGSLSPLVALAAAVVCALMGGVGIGALVAIAREPLAAGLALAIGIGAWGYSAPPVRLLARGLGEIDTSLVVAMLVPLCAYAAQGRPLDAWAIASTLPGTTAMFAMMLAVEFPDLAADRAGGKRNLIVRFGTRFAGRLAIALAIAVYLAVALAVAIGAPVALAYFELGSLPVALFYAAALRRWRFADHKRSEVLASGGVAFFVTVTLCALLAYAAPLRGIRAF